jgi:hypothetical protein
MVRDFGFLLVAFVKIETVAERDTLAGGHDKVTGRRVSKLLEIMFAKGIGGK